jgi:SNF2 family DNA or RNA helicase
VRYLLQAVDDPSLLIPAKDAWKGDNLGFATQASALFKREGFDAREYLLLSLGQAAGICPHIETSLKKSAPGGYELNADGAYEFFLQKTFALEQVGFGVMLPAWWTGKGTKQRLSARAIVKAPKMQEGSGLSLDEIVQFDWEVSLGGERLSLQELRALAKLKAPLVKVRGQWVQMSAEEIQAALHLLKEKTQSQTTTGREALQMALGGIKIPGSLTFDGVTATGWLADFLDQLDGRAAYEEIPVSPNFRGALRPYQRRGYSWLFFLRQWGLGACLADDMGLGKTIQTLALLQRDRQGGENRPVLLICPMSVVNNWLKEANRFTPDLSVMIHHGIGRTKGSTFKEKAIRQAMVISSYALVHRDFETLKEVPWAGVVLDEAQNIKNPETKQARAVRAFQTGYRLALTGTPVENNVGDLWSIMEFLNPGFLGTQSDFKKTFFIPIQSSRDPEAVKKLKRLTTPFILRRLKTDKTIISDLPEKMEMKVFCNLTKEQASLYAAVVEEVEGELNSAEGIQRKGMILATLSKLKQVCNHPAQFLGDNSPIPGRSGKLARLTEMLEEVVAVGDRALVFTQFSEMGGILKRYLQEMFGREVIFLHGAVPKKQRDSMVERFQANDREAPSVFILSLKAGGTGLNLTRASHVFHFDRWWNPAVENQATDRAFRIGQTKNVQVHKFLCAGTLEEKIDEMIERKKGIAEDVVGTGEGWLTELSTSELKEIFALRKEAIGE